MDKEKIAELEAAVATAKSAAEGAGGLDENLNKAFTEAESALSKAKEPSQTNKDTRTEAEKAAYNLKKRADEARAQGLDPADVLGIKPQIKIDGDLPDDAPLTVGTFKQMQKQEAKKTALQMAQELPEDERDEVIEILSNRLVPSGNAEKDLELARHAVNSERNTKIAAELSRKGKPRQTAAGGSGNAPTGDDFEPTADEAVFMRPPYSMSKDKILAARKAAEAKSAQ